MNNEPLVPEFDLLRWFGAITEIFRMIADEPFFACAAGALMLGFAFLLLYRLTLGGD